MDCSSRKKIISSEFTGLFYKHYSIIYIFIQKIFKEILSVFLSSLELFLKHIYKVNGNKL